MKKNLSIRAYLILSHSLLLAISLTTVGFLWSRNEYRIITDELQSMVIDRATLIADIASHELAEEGEIGPEYFALSQEIEIASNRLHVVYIDPSGAFVTLSRGKIEGTVRDEFQEIYYKEGLSETSYVELVDKDTEVSHIYAGAPVFDTNGRVLGMICVLYPLSRMEMFIAQQRWMLVGTILLIALLGIGISVFLANNVSRHFLNVQKLAGTVAEGNYYLRIPESGPRELHDMAHYMNTMAARLSEQATIRQNLLSNVAHELARPLAGLQLGIESLRKGALRDLNLTDDMLFNMGMSLNHLSGLIEDIALAAQPANRPILLKRTAVAVEPFLKGVAARFWTLAQSRGVHIEVKVEPNLPPVDADEKRLNQIIGNLLHNALKFTPHGRNVYLSAELAEARAIRIIVRDCGVGISNEEAAHLFEPFYQGQSGRRIKQGMGLGLAIAHQLAQAHGGDLTLENDPEGGAVAILTLPVASA